MKNISTSKMIVQLKDNNMDYEWYPTTKNIIDTIKIDINDIHDNPSILDCGAGDGRVLNALTNGDKYAIEKAKPLLNSLNKNIYIVGTEFEAQTLLDKKVDIIFSNPPYSVFEFWATKIIREANAGHIYLVIPSRWNESNEIQEAITLRKAKVEILGSFNFINAERQARAKIDIIKIILCSEYSWGKGSPKEDPFKIWFESNFKIEITKTEQSKYDLDLQAKSSLNEKLSHALIKGSNIITVLEELYQRDLEKLIKTYQNLCHVDPQILKELDVNLDGVRKALSHKIENLKDCYWHELFNNLKTITDKLTASSRDQLLKTLTAHTHVDFTSSNAHAIVCWVIKNANGYFESQLVCMVKNMTEKVNIILYKSNKRTFGDEQWRYCQTPSDLNNYCLDYRIVLHNTGGISTSDYSYDSINGLSKRAAIFINDMCTIATNLGYNTQHLYRVESFTWESNSKRVFQYRDITTGNLKSLFEVRAFKNGNLHIKFKKEFICRLNVEFGRLEGWLKSPKDAINEMDIPSSVAELSFGSNLRLESKNILSLEFKNAA